MSAAAKLAAVKAQLAELERLAEEERRKAEEEAKKRAEEKARRKAEEEKRRAEEEERRKAEEERQRTEEERWRTAELVSQAIPQKRKSAHPDSEHEEDEEDEAQGEEAEVLHKPSLGRTCRFRDGPRTSSCTECQRRAAPCLGAKGLPAAMQARVDRKSGDSPQRKRVKKSAPIVVEDDDEPATPSKKKSKGKGKEMGTEKRSTEKGPGVAAGGAESRAGGSGGVHLGREEKEWSLDPEPEQLTDRELLQHVLVEGQKTRLGMSRLLHHLEEEGELRAQWALADSKVVRQAVRKEVGKWAEEELRPLIRAEIRSVLAEFFATPAEQEDGEGQEEGEGQEGEGEGGEGGEEGAPAE
ncbi:hypothetical protein PYCCODRAFT_1464236 [Trametes coccinea BRFM310]|uniref:Uncharacterized protein n=1 Tax=Trametes coccinea (strain BRFM310) TaxID=1353009 RepID=A0A1Y2IYX5_TRAC3|nr:hypothetical protein PYCCODRAFT_1464236 [Trametes coccinea BRFM310]